MTFLEKLQSHKGGLIHIKSQLCWYGGRGWDGSPGRICLVLDAAAADPLVDEVSAAATATAATAASLRDMLRADVVTALLLIDGCPQWVWMSREDVEAIDETR